MSVSRPITHNAAPDEELVARIRGGDKQAFEALFMAYYSALHGFIAHYVDGETGAELLQEIFLALWRKRETWDPVGGVRAYLFAAARNRAFSAMRGRRMLSRLAEQSAAEDTAPGASQSDKSPAQAVLAAEVESACRAAIRGLPERNRLVMMLRWDYGMSHAEIAFVLDTTIKGVEAELSRGLRALATQLAWLKT
jgi:RNA polymerase sigma-70 factor, ECF subfamily